VAAIVSSSVETTMASKQELAWAASMGQARIGRPPNGRMFFLGMRLLPPRAGTTARLLTFAKSTSLAF
jgi:hypothetical protein